MEDKEAYLMRVLLFSMPDAFEHMPALAIRMPNGALTSLAGNVDPRHQVSVADLILVYGRVRPTIEHLMQKLQPDVVGLSVMTFQRRTARQVIQLVRSIRPSIQIVVGGYDPSLAPEEYSEGSPVPADFIIRGEGEKTLEKLLHALENRLTFGHISGLSYRAGNHFCHNPDRPVARL
ncbi:MAG TPA: cobalamin-dependent protein, partial [Acidobacteriota bacterium]|nr:cobalamin-dependent protein [Acidobacteriota bacterium]